MVKDYKPIAYFNVIYKVISKIIANRLKKLLPAIILENQLAVVQCHLVIENVLLATEPVKDYNSTTISSRFSVKIDISKAFCSVQWNLFLDTLPALGLPESFVHWIRLCITAPLFQYKLMESLLTIFKVKYV